VRYQIFYITLLHLCLTATRTFMPSPLHTICLQTYSKISLSRADTQHQVDKRIEKLLPDAWQSPLAWLVAPLYGTAPRYLTVDCVPVYELAQRRHLRSAAGYQLVVPSYSLNSCDLRAFSVLGPRLWNSLPLLLRDSHNTTSFGHSLQTSFLSKY